MFAIMYLGCGDDPPQASSIINTNMSLNMNAHKHLRSCNDASRSPSMRQMSEDKLYTPAHV